MRKKIQDLIKGIYEYERPELILSEERICFEVLEEGEYRGSFSMTSSGEQRIRGLITCDNPRMKCLTTQFDSTSVTVDYEYCARSVTEGTVDKGQFVIVSSSGEYVLPFEAVPVKYYYRSSIGKIKTLNDFSNLAKLNWDEALNVFKSRYFHNIFPDTKTALLYEGLCSRGISSHEMEEFLIGTGKKSRNQFEIDVPVRTMGKLKQPVSDSIRVERSGWGYVDIRISSEAPFIRLEKTRLLPADFAGRRAEVSYSVEPGYMHGGKNYGEIVFKTAFEEKRVQICARRAGDQKPDAAQAARKYNQRALYVLIQKYVDYRLGRAESEVWGRETLEILDKMIERDPSDVWNFLFKCHVLILTGKQSDAEWILEDAACSCKKRNTPAWCYVRYLEMILRQAEEEKERVMQEVISTFQRYPNHLLLFMLKLLMMEATPEKIQEKYETVKEFLMKPSASPVLYMEAYLILKEHPQLMREMDEAEFRIFYWAAKQNLLTDKMVSAIITAAPKEKSFHNRFLWLLGRCYKIAKNDGAVRAVCTYLIKNNRYGEAYLTWFSRGLEKRMRIAGLCEAYMQSWRKTDGDIPWRVLQYFTKKTELPATYKARLYAYVVRNRQRIGKEWKAYEKLIPEFLMDELRKNHMSDDLAELCRYIRETKPEELRTDILVNTVFSNKIICSGYGFSGVVVCEKGKKGISVPLVQNAAYVHIRNKKYQILFEDSFGRRYFLKDGYRVNHMLPGAPEQEEREEQSTLEKPAEQLPGAESEEMLDNLSGPVEDLSHMIAEAQSRGRDVSRLQEQLLIRMLFTENYSKDHAQYFRAVCRLNDTKQLRDAYVSYFSWRYIYLDEQVPEEIFEYLEYSVEHNTSFNDCCETALLKWYCKNGWKDREDFFIKVFEKNLAQGCYFPFYEELPSYWKRKYFIHDCRYFWAASKPGRKIHCCLQADSRGKKKQEDRMVAESLPGLYVLPVRLFAGEIVEYRFYESEEYVLKSGTARLTPREIATAEESRYQALNQALEEAVERTEKLKKYAEMTDMVNCLFKPL